MNKENPLDTDNKHMNIGAKRGAALVRLIEDFCDSQAWSVREFARRAGVRHSTISAWKNSDVVPDTRSLSKIANVMGLDLPELWMKLKPVDDNYVSLNQILDTLRTLEADDLAKIGNQVNTLLLSKCSA
jgi:transcriptional regulator with XRE-family HTH domain